MSVSSLDEKPDILKEISSKHELEIFILVSKLAEYIDISFFYNRT